MKPLLVTSLKGEVSNQYLARVQKAYRVILYLMSFNVIDIFQKTSACKYIWIMQYLKSHMDYAALEIINHCQRSHFIGSGSTKSSGKGGC